MCLLGDVCWSVMLCVVIFFFFKQKTAYEMRISDWSSDVCSSDLLQRSIGDGDAGPKTLGGVALKRLAFAQIEIMDMIGLASHEPARLPRQIGGDGRSEERRVGKECVSTCRSRWSPYH